MRHGNRDEKHIEVIPKGECVYWEKSSENLTNPRKQFYLKLAAAAECEVKDDRDKKEALCVRRDMIGSVMVLSFNGQWRVCRLFLHLQKIVAKYPENVLDMPVADNLKLDGEVMANG